MFSKIFKSKRITSLIVIFSYIYFFLVGLPILWIIKRKFKVKKIIIGHYHIPLNIKSFLILEAYFFNNKIYRFGDFYVITDIHLGLVDYKDEELKNLESLLDKKLIILGDFFEKRVRRKLKKKEVELFYKTLNNKNVIYIKGNHDWFIDKYFDLNTKEVYFDEKRKILFSHGHLQDPYFKFIGKIYLKYGEKLNLLNNFLREMSFLIGKIRKEEFF